MDLTTRMCKKKQKRHIKVKPYNWGCCWTCDECQPQPNHNRSRHTARARTTARIMPEPFMPVDMELNKTTATVPTKQTAQTTNGGLQIQTQIFLQRYVCVCVCGIIQSVTLSAGCKRRGRIAATIATCCRQFSTTHHEEGLILFYLFRI